VGCHRRGQERRLGGWWLAPYGERREGTRSRPV
jgi:hypothetical protein